MYVMYITVSMSKFGIAELEPSEDKLQLMGSLINEQTACSKTDGDIIALWVKQSPGSIRKDEYVEPDSNNVARKYQLGCFTFFL